MIELHKQFLPKISLLRASNPNIIIYLKNKGKRGKKKNQIPEPIRHKTHFWKWHITNYFKQKKKKKILGSHFVSGFYYLSKIGKLNSGLLAHKITSSNDQSMQTEKHLQEIIIKKSKEES